MIISSYKHLGGKNPETATIRNALAALGVKAPHTGKPFTEEMLLGIGGGLVSATSCGNLKSTSPRF